MDSLNLFTSLSSDQPDSSSMVPNSSLAWQWRARCVSSHIYVCSFPFLSIPFCRCSSARGQVLRDRGYLERCAQWEDLRLSKKPPGFPNKKPGDRGKSQMKVALYTNNSNKLSLKMLKEILVAKGKAFHNYTISKRCPGISKVSQWQNSAQLSQLLNVESRSRSHDLAF